MLINLIKYVNTFRPSIEAIVNSYSKVTSYTALFGKKNKMGKEFQVLYEFICFAALEIQFLSFKSLRSVSTSKKNWGFTLKMK